MACEDWSTLQEPLQDFTGQALFDAFVCAFSSDAGAGVGFTVFSLFFFGFLGMGLTVRTQHPGPILVAGILSAGVMAIALPAGSITILALVLFFGIMVLGLYLYQRAQSSL